MEKLIDLIQDIRDNEIWMSKYFDKGKNKEANTYDDN